MAVYEAQIVCITAVVSSTWSPDPILLQSHYIEKLDICHRKHLRSLLNIRWPHVIMALYIFNVHMYKQEYAPVWGRA